jgi:TPR repeat protein
MACCDAGHTLERGTVVKKDLDRAAAFYRRGCGPDEGPFISCIGLANLYGKGGPGPAKDRKLRDTYYRRAKLLGYSEHLEDD